MIFHLGVNVKKEPTRFGAPEMWGEMFQPEGTAHQRLLSCLGLSEGERAERGQREGQRSRY